MVPRRRRPRLGRCGSRPRRAALSVPLGPFAVDRMAHPVSQPRVAPRRVEGEIRCQTIGPAGHKTVRHAVYVARLQVPVGTTSW